MRSTILRAGLVLAVATLLASCDATGPSRGQELVFRQVSAGTIHTCGTTVGGAAYCWGYGFTGELGTGVAAASESPALVAGGLNFRAVSAQITVPDIRYGFTCGVTVSGAVHCWGSTFGSGATFSLSPKDVSGGHIFESVSTGYMPCALTSTGAAYCWEAEWDALSFEYRLLPVDVSHGLTFQTIGSGGGRRCGLATNGAAYCWDGLDSTWKPVPGGLTFESIDGGSTHACGLTSGGAAYCWGDNYAGGLGDGTTTPSSSPVPVQGFGLTFQSISAGELYSCGLTDRGAAYCWGHNAQGQLGDGTTTSSPRPVPVAGGLAFQQISAGGAHTCGVTTSGAAYCWGNGGYGENGDGTTRQRSRPVRVVGAGATPLRR